MKALQWVEPRLTAKVRHPCWGQISSACGGKGARLGRLNTMSAISHTQLRDVFLLRTPTVLTSHAMSAGIGVVFGWEAPMGSFRRHHTFDPLDLEIIDRVYEATWAKIEARYLYRDTSRDDERQKALRRWLFILAASGPVDFDTLYDKVVASLPKTGPRNKPQR